MSLRSSNCTSTTGPCTEITFPKPRRCSGVFVATEATSAAALAVSGLSLPPSAFFACGNSLSSIRLNLLITLASCHQTRGKNLSHAFVNVAFSGLVKRKLHALFFLLHFLQTRLQLLV